VRWALSRSAAQGDSGTKRHLPFFPRLINNTASLRSTSLSSSPIVSLTRSPVTAIGPKSVEQVHPRTPKRVGDVHLPNQIPNLAIQ
jgi:hypothetical protein